MVTVAFDQTEHTRYYTSNVHNCQGAKRTCLAGWEAPGRQLPLRAAPVSDAEGASGPGAVHEEVGLPGTFGTCRDAQYHVTPMATRVRCNECFTDVLCNQIWSVGPKGLSEVMISAALDLGATSSTADGS